MNKKMQKIPLKVFLLTAFSIFLFVSAAFLRNFYTHNTIRNSLPVLISDKGSIINSQYSEISIKSSVVKADISKNDILGEKIILNARYFPGLYEVNLNGNDVSKKVSSCGGTICLNKSFFNEGNNFLYWTLNWTIWEKVLVFGGISMLVLAMIFLYIYWREIKLDNKSNFFFIALLFLILAIFCYLRFYHLQNRVGFAWDQERDAMAVREILRGNLTLVGPRVVGENGFFLPPYFFYILAPFYLITGRNPTAIVLFLYFVNLSFFAFALFVLKKVFNKWIALLFLIIWSFHRLSLTMDGMVWNPLLIPFLVLALIYLLYLYSIKETKIKLLFIGILLGFGTSIHVQFALLFPVCLPFLAKDKSLGKFMIKTLYLVLGFGIVFIPLIFFDLRHNFLNLNLMKAMLINGGEKDALAFLPVWKNFIQEVYTYPIGTVFAVTLFLLFPILVFLIAKGKSLGETAKRIVSGLVLVWFSAPLFFAFYGQRPSEYYFNYLFVIFVLGLSITIYHIIALAPGKSKYIAILLLVFISLSLLAKSNDELKIKRFASLGYKMNAVEFLANITKNSTPFNVSKDITIGQDYGYEYLLNFFQVKSTGNPKDTLIEIVIPPEKKPDAFIVDGIGIYLPQGWFEKNWLN